jgi:hypothetical protein
VGILTKRRPTQFTAAPSLAATASMRRSSARPRTLPAVVAAGRPRPEEITPPAITAIMIASVTAAAHFHGNLRRGASSAGTAILGARRGSFRTAVRAKSIRPARAISVSVRTLRPCD